MSGEPGRQRQVSVIGSGVCGEETDAWRLAEEVGRQLAEAGICVVCGGRGGVMEAASRGATGAGGNVIGVLPWVSVEDANPYCTQVVATGIGEARNLSVVASGEAAIAIGGEWGTLSEIALARKLGRTVVALRSWSVAAPEAMADDPGIVAAETAEEAVSVALAAIARG